eukprot:COSAG06_NODE_288_length_18224_cov_8.849948_23_plen_192_part_00
MRTDRGTGIDLTPSLPTTHALPTPSRFVIHIKLRTSCLYTADRPRRCRCHTCPAHLLYTSTSLHSPDLSLVGCACVIACVYFIPETCVCVLFLELVCVFYSWNFCVWFVDGTSAFTVSSPMMVGTDIRLMTPIMKELLLNKEAVRCCCCCCYCCCCILLALQATQSNAAQHNNIPASCCPSLCFAALGELC